MAFRKLPIEKMTPKGMYLALNDWWSSIEADLDDDSEDDNEKYAQSAEKLYDLWEEVGFKLSDYMWASGYNIKGIGQMAKIGFPAKKRTDPEWLKMNESRMIKDVDEAISMKNSNNQYYYQDPKGVVQAVGSHDAMRKMNIKQAKDGNKGGSFSMNHKKYKVGDQIKESAELDEASEEGKIRVIDLSDAHPDNRMGATEKSGFQVQRMTKGKFVNQGKPYAKKAQAEKERSSGQASMQFEGVKATGAQAKALHKLMLRALDKKQMPTTRNGHTSSIATNGDFVVHGSMGQVAGRIKKGDFVDPMKESVQISEATDFKSTFDGLKKGDTVKIKYGSSLSKGQEGTFKVTFKSIVGKAKVGKITLVKQGEGAAKLKHYLYDRNGKVSMAMGDMGASMTSLVKESVNIEEGAISKKLTGLVDKGLNKVLDKLEKMTGKHLGFVQKSTVPSAGKDAANDSLRGKQFKKEAEDFHRKAKKQWTWSKKEVGDSFRYYGDDGKIPPEQREAVSDLQAEMQRIIDMHTQLEKMMQTTGNSAKYQRTMEKLDSDTSRVFEEIGKVTERGDARYRAAQGIANLKKANKMTHKEPGQKSPAKFRSYANRGESVDESFLDRIKFTPKTSVENLSEKKNSYLMKKIKEDAETTDTWKDQVANRRVDRVAPSGTGMTEADFVAMHSPENAEVYDFVNAPVVIAKTHETIANSTSEGPKRHNDTDDGDANIVRKGT
jgi:hypothetical protein